MTDEADRPYSGHEGDINEKLLLDLDWERQQTKVRMAMRARWRVDVACCNLYLSCRQGRRKVFRSGEALGVLHPPRGIPEEVGSDLIKYHVSTHL